MRMQEDCYNQMLDLQTTIQFPFEHSFYENSYWHQANEILDVGCGNGAYAARLNMQYPDRFFTGIEPDSKRRSEAIQKNFPSKQVLKQIEDLPAGKTFDFVLLRLVLLHVDDQKYFLESLMPFLSPNASILVIDALHEEVQFSNAPTNFLNILKKLSDQANTRNISQTVNATLSQYGFVNKRNNHCIINSSFPHTKDLFPLYFQYLTELGNGGPLPSNIAQTIQSWWNSDPYVQYSIFGQLMTRKE